MSTTAVFGASTVGTVPSPPRFEEADHGYRICGGCGAIHHLSERFHGRGRHRDEHPEHVYAPCGCSQTWFTARMAHECPCCGLPATTPGQCGDCARYDAETFAEEDDAREATRAS